MAKQKSTNDTVESVPTNSKGVIHERKLLELLYGHSKYVRFKDVPIPSEQSSTQLQPSMQVSSILQAVAMAKESIMNESKPMWYLIVTLMATGARVSEVLALRPHDIAANGMVLLKGSKGSHDRLANCGDATSFLIDCKKKGVSPFAVFNRVFVWRYLKRKGLYTALSDSEKMSVAHMFRHIYIEQAKELSGSSETVQRSIGHKSIKSTEHYESNKVTTKARVKRGRK